MYILLRGVTPFAIYDSKVRDWTSVFRSSNKRTHFRSSGQVSSGCTSIISSTTSPASFVPIVLVAHAISYYFKFQDRELRASQLGGPTRKISLAVPEKPASTAFPVQHHDFDLSPHANPRAAHRTITRLADLLRMNLEWQELRSRLNRELEFVVAIEIEQGALRRAADF